MVDLGARCGAVGLVCRYRLALSLGAVELGSGGGERSEVLAVIGIDTAEVRDPGMPRTETLETQGI